MTARSASHDTFEEYAAGHALSALEPEEEQAFLAHLSGCARCERDLAMHSGIAAQLAHEVADADPPDSLLAGIREGVRASGRQPHRAGGAVVLDLARARRRPLPSRSLAVVGAAAALALVVSLTSWNTSLRHDQQRSAEAGARLTAAVRALESPGSRTVALTPSASTPSGRAVALLRAGSVSLVVDGFRPNDTRRSTYVLWARNAGGPVVAVGTFDVTTSGVDVVQALTVPSGAPLRQLAVTLEPGRSAPPSASTEMLVTGTVT